MDRTNTASDEVTRPGPRAPARKASLVIVLAITALLLSGFILQPAHPHGSVVLTLFGIPLPTICWFKLTTGLPCAGCGLTRSVVLLLHGDPRASWAMHPFGVAFVALALLTLPSRIASAAGRTGRWIAPWERAWFAAAALTGVVMFGWWVARMGRILWIW